jgi:AcrR family transcriptional regulator
MEVKNKKRQDILMSAKILFKEKGFHNTKMEEIAENANVGKGTLYGYFLSKQDIFDESCIDNMVQMCNTIDIISQKNISFKEKLIEIFNEKSKTMAHEDITLESILSQKNLVSEKVVKNMMKHIINMYSVIVEIVEQGKREGVVKESIPSETITYLILGTMSQYFGHKVFIKESKVNINEYDKIFDLFFNGFGVK